MPTVLPDTASCLTCGYALRGLPSDVCPECGRAFDPADPRTYKPGPKPPWWHGRTEPQPWYYRWPLIVLTIVLILDVSVPGTHRGFFVLGGVLVYPCGTFFFVIFVIADYGRRLAARSLFREQYPDLPMAKKRSNKRWWVAPICITLMLSAILTAWPMHLRFAISRPAMERAAREFLDGKRTYTKAQWIGGYYVTWVDVEHDNGRVYFETGETLIDTIGFLYDSNITPPPWWHFDLQPPWSLLET